MATETGAFDTYEAIGNREDLSDIIFDVSPVETPFLSKLSKKKATSTKHEWQIDALAAASGANFVIEGEATTIDASTATSRVYNYTAISDKAPSVSGTQEAVTSAGRRSEMAYQMMKAMKELKRDQETILLQNTASAVGTTSSARKCGGLQTWVLTNTDVADDATPATGDGTDVHTDGTARALTEALVEGVLATGWSNGAMPTVGYLNAFQKRKFATFSGNATPYVEKEGKKVINTVDVYIDPLGTSIELTPTRQCPTDVVYFVDHDYVSLAELRPYQTKDMAYIGDVVRKQMLTEYTLEVGNEAGHCGIYDLTAS